VRRQSRKLTCPGRRRGGQRHQHLLQCQCTDTAVAWAPRLHALLRLSLHLDEQAAMELAHRRHQAIRRPGEATRVCAMHTQHQVMQQLGQVVRMVLQRREGLGTQAGEVQRVAEFGVR
jgi:hypothetical protein